jgi:hypothetical protein
MTEVRIDETCLKCGKTDFNYYEKSYFNYPNPKLYVICENCRIKVKHNKNPIIEEIQIEQQERFK